MTTEFTKEQIEAAGKIEHYFDDLGETMTVKAFLVNLLRTLWTEGEGFNGKRPFGNSGWEFDLYTALVKGKAIEGGLDDEGYLDGYDRKAGDRMIFEIIDSME